MFWKIKLFIYLIYSKLIKYNNEYKRLKKAIEFREYKANVTFSGRTALTSLAYSLKSKKDVYEVLLPEYLCNIVYFTFLEAGFEIKTYKTDKNFEIQESLENLIDNNQNAIILLASVYGSSCELNNKNIQEIILKCESKNLFLIYDLAQNFNLRYYLPQTSPNVYAILSFNDKQNPGLMLGCVLASEYIDFETFEIQNYQKKSLKHFWNKKFFGFNQADLKETFRLKKIYQNFKKYFAKNSKMNFEINSTITFDFSSGTKFPWTLVNYKPIKLQLSIALFGLKNQKLFHNYKPIKLEKNALPTPFYFQSPYIILSTDQGNKNIKQKQPYALSTDKNQSLRPDLKVFHNKGFWDFYNA